MSEFFNKIIIVTGGFKGNGNAIVNRFLKEGAKVYSLDNLYKKKTERLRNQINMKVDLSNFKDLKKNLIKIALKEKKIDILVNNAGISLKSTKKNFLLNWEKTIAINLTAPYLLSHYSLPYLKKSEYPSIINITSLNGKIAMSNNPSYNASKGGLSALNACLAMDFSKYNIRVNGVSPGYIKTDMTKKSRNNKKEYLRRINRTMNKTFGKPEDIANTVIFLASEKSKYINAAEIIVDGGFLKKGI